MKTHQSLQYLFRSNLVVASLALGLIACAGSKAETNEPVVVTKPVESKVLGEVVPDRSAQSGNTKAADIGVELLEPGKKPRSELRYNVKPDYVAIAEARATSTIDGEKISNRSYVIMAVVESADDTEKISVSYVIPTGQNGELINDMALAETATEGLGATVSYTNRGRLTAFEPFTDDPTQIKTYEIELFGLLNTPYLPAERVGVGAKWKIHTPASVAQPTRADKMTTSELVSVEGSVITIETTIVSDIPRRVINGKQFSKKRVHATKRVVVDLADPISVFSHSYELSQDVKMLRENAGKTDIHRMSTTMNSRRLGDAMTSD